MTLALKLRETMETAGPLFVRPFLLSKHTAKVASSYAIVMCMCVCVFLAQQTPLAGSPVSFSFSAQRGNGTTK